MYAMLLLLSWLRCNYSFDACQATITQCLSSVTSVMLLLQNAYPPTPVTLLLPNEYPLKSARCYFSSVNIADVSEAAVYSRIYMPMHVVPVLLKAYPLMHI